MKTLKIYATMLLVLISSAMSARTVSRCYDGASEKFCVRVDGKLMTIAEYDNWLYANRPSAYAADTVLAYWMKRHLGDRPSTDSRNYRGCTFATRTMKWGGKTLTAWAVIDDSGHECSHWVFAGSGEGYGCRWLLEEAGIDYVNVTLQLCADTICWTWGYLDENGKLMMWTGEDDNGKNKYIPWDWKRVDA